jgi:molybdopterin-synthase adenylyltransferase
VKGNKGNMVPEAEERLRLLVRERSDMISDPAGNEVPALGEDQAMEIARLCGKNLRGVYRTALVQGVCPLRYLRNREEISLEGQQRLLDSQATVVGVGGLGGYVIQILARIGIGCMVVVDPDRFDESNLNRQAFSTVANLGRDKTAVLSEAVMKINPSVRVKAFPKRFDPTNAREILEGSNIVVDALDNVPDRLALEKAAEEMRVPLVHGAVAGFEGRLAVVFPGDRTLEQLYHEEGQGQSNPAAPEAVLGVPSVTPAVIAGLQAMEAVKILLNRGKSFRGKMVHLDLENGQWHEFSLIGG